MAHLERQRIEYLLVSTSETNEYSNPINGYLAAVQYIPDGTTYFPATADFLLRTTDRTVVCLTSAIQCTTAGFLHFPRASLVTSAGASSGLRGMFPLANQRLQLTVLNGAATTGAKASFVLYAEGSIAGRASTST